MLERFHDLGRDILEQTATAGHVHGLHTPADTEQRKAGPARLVDDIQFKVCAAFAHNPERVPLPFAVECRGEIRSASGEEESVKLRQQASP